MFIAAVDLPPSVAIDMRQMRGLASDRHLDDLVLAGVVLLAEAEDQFMLSGGLDVGQ